MISSQAVFACARGGHAEVEAFDPSMDVDPPSTAERGVVTGEAMRHVLGHFASGVIVVTADAPSGPVGMTCQSFTSLSLDPPLVSLCPSLTSTSWPHIRQARCFCVNVLAGHQAPLSAQFSRPGAAKFTGVASRPSTHGAPILEDVTAWIECRFWAEYPGGDHTIAIGEVLSLSADSERAPLLFLRGQYLPDGDRTTAMSDARVPRGRG